MRLVPLALLPLAACWVGAPPPQAPPPEAAAAPAQVGPPPGAEVHRSQWRGTYTCAQGATAVELSVEQRCGAVGCQVAAVFEFGPLAENPSVPHGSYRMLGEITTDGDGNAVLTLRPEAWIDEPDGYMMVGLTATSDHDQRLLHGHMDNPSCGEISLDRVE